MLDVPRPSTPYTTHCRKHDAADPRTALWRVDITESGKNPNHLFGKRLNGHIVRILRDDGSHEPRFASVFPGTQSPGYISVKCLLPI